jgi:hypothetical protein
MENKEEELIKLLRDITAYSFNMHCDCASCKAIKDRLEEVLKEKKCQE